MTHHKIALSAHHLTRFASTNPLEAVSELIWNGLDADADKINVTTEFDVLDTMTVITVSDNGLGIPFAEIVDRFNASVTAGNERRGSPNSVIASCTATMAKAASRPSRSAG